MSAEWCEHEDFVLHTEIGGENVATHVKVQQLSTKEAAKEWQKAGNIRLTGTDDPDAIAVLIVGPPWAWKATLFGNHGYAQDTDPEATYGASQSVVFLLHKKAGA